MMHVILAILKIIGIIVLVLLALLAVLLLLLLFVPLRYRLHVQRDQNQLEAQGQMTWLLHLVGANLRVFRQQGSLHGSAQIRVAGFRLKSFHFFGKEEDAGSLQSEDASARADAKRTALTGTAEEEAAKSGELPGTAEEAAKSGELTGTAEEEAAKSEALAATAEEEAAKSGEPADAVKEEAAKSASSASSKEEANGRKRKKADSGKEKTRPGLLARIMDLASRVLNRVLGLILQIPGLPAEVYDRIDSMQDRLCRKYDTLRKKADPFLSIEAEHMLGKGIRYLRYLIRGYAPRKMIGHIRFGTGSPDLTGKLTGLLYVLLPKSGTGYDVEPDFYEAVLDTDTMIQGQIRAYRLMWVAVRLLVDREFWTLIRRIRGKEKKESSHRGARRLRKKASQQSAA